jgi:prepilin-type processing-associated H-X9-DG protein
MPAVLKEGGWEPALNDLDMAYEPPRHLGGNNFAFVDGHVEWLPFPGGRWIDGGPWVVPDMAMYSRTGHWEASPVRCSGSSGLAGWARSRMVGVS